MLQTCISLSRATPLGRSRYQTSEFPTISELPTELPTHEEDLKSIAALRAGIGMCITPSFPKIRNSLSSHRN